MKHIAWYRHLIKAISSKALHAGLILFLGGCPAEAFLPPLTAADTYLDVGYAVPPPGVAATALMLDLYVPSGSTAAPLVVFVHGGGWKNGDKRAGGPGHQQAILGAGFAFASVNYRLLEDGPPDVGSADIAIALAFLQNHSTDYGLDTSRIALMGHSAGAHLAALVALDAQYLAGAGVPREAIRAVALLDGAGYDIVRQMEAGNAALYREVFGTDPVYMARMSPLTYARATPAPAFILHHIEGRAVSREQSEALAAALVSAGNVATTHEALNETHASINRGFGAEGDVTTALTVAFLQQHLAQTASLK